MRFVRRRWVAAVSGALAMGLLGGPASADALREQIQACAANQDDAARLRCFDNAAKGLPAAASASAPAVASASAPDSNPASPANAPVRASKPHIEAAPVLVTRVVSVTRPGDREYRIVLDNGQVWQENEHNIDLELAVGDTVRIKAGSLGSFFLRTESGHSTRVRRIR